MIVKIVAIPVSMVPGTALADIDQFIFHILSGIPFPLSAVSADPCSSAASGRHWHTLHAKHRKWKNHLVAEN